MQFIASGAFFWVSKTFLRDSLVKRIFRVVSHVAWPQISTMAKKIHAVAQA